MQVFKAKNKTFGKTCGTTCDSRASSVSLERPIMVVNLENVFNKLIRK